MKILYLTPILDFPPSGGPQLRIDTSIKALSRVCDLHIIYLANYPSSSTNKANQFYSNFSNNFKVIYKHKNYFLFRVRSSRFYNKFFKDDLNKSINLILNYIKEYNIEFVWFGFGNISFPLIKNLKKRLPHIKVVCDTDSVWSRFILRELPFIKNEVRRKKIELNGRIKELEEKEWVNLCDVTTAVSDIDMEYYEKLANKKERIQKFSNVIDLSLYKSLEEKPKNFIKPCLYLAGSFAPNSAMNMAALWVLNEILPILWRSYPNLHFYIVGRNSDEEFKNYESKNVSVTGMLDTVIPYLSNADVAIVPLKFESGTRFKILEAGACYTPIVSTTLGAEGIPVVNGKHLLIADDTLTFARSIEKILDNKNLSNKLTKNCFNLVKKNYDIENLVYEAKKVLDYLKNG